MRSMILDTITEYLLRAMGLVLLSLGSVAVSEAASDWKAYDGAEAPSVSGYMDVHGHFR